MVNKHLMHHYLGHAKSYLATLHNSLWGIINRQAAAHCYHNNGKLHTAMEQTGRCGTTGCGRNTQVHTQIHLMYSDSHHIPLSWDTITHHQPCTSRKLSQACQFNEPKIHDIGSWFSVAGNRCHLAALTTLKDIRTNLPTPAHTILEVALKNKDFCYLPFFPVSFKSFEMNNNSENRIY